MGRVSEHDLFPEFSLQTAGRLDSVNILDLRPEFTMESPEGLFDTGYWVPLPDFLP